MVESGVMINPPPIKKQTLAEKKHIIKNYNHLLEIYNRWIEHNPGIGVTLNLEILDQFAKSESERWNTSSTNVALNVEQNSC